jgi:hypothetical protein
MLSLRLFVILSRSKDQSPADTHGIEPVNIHRKLIRRRRRDKPGRSE